MRYLSRTMCFTLLTIFLTGCLGSLNPMKLPEKFQTATYKPTGVNEKFSIKGKDFAAYVLETKEMIKSGRKIGQSPFQSEAAIKGNAPQEIIPANVRQGETNAYRDAVILIHSLQGSPFEMKELAMKFARKGMVVRTILLPGHGTVPGDLTNVRYSDWNKAVDFVVKDTLKIADNVHIAGYSTGGGLAVQKAYEYPVKSLLLFSPLIEINSNLEQLTPLVASAGKIFSTAKWEALDIETNPYKYRSNTFQSVAQVYKLQKKIGSLKKTPLNIPVFIAAPLDDIIVDTNVTLDFFRNNTHQDSTMTVYAHTQFKTNDSRIRVVNASIPSKRILNLSHVGMTSSPNNPVYGRTGSVKSCSAYNDKPEMLRLCKTAPSHTVFFGGKNMIKEDDKRIVRRITFNPYFSQMLTSIDRFLTSIDS